MPQLRVAPRGVSLVPSTAGDDLSLRVAWTMLRELADLQSDFAGFFIKKKILQDFSRAGCRGFRGVTSLSGFRARPASTAVVAIVR